jgi:hypothetical protein
MGALYSFVEVRSDVLPDFDDQAFALDLLENKHVLVAPGVSFNVPYRNCFRITNLPEPQVLATVFARIEEVLDAQAAPAGRGPAGSAAGRIHGEGSTELSAEFADPGLMAASRPATPCLRRIPNSRRRCSPRSSAATSSRPRCLAHPARARFRQLAAGSACRRQLRDAASPRLLGDIEERELWRIGDRLQRFGAGCARAQRAPRARRAGRGAPCTSTAFRCGPSPSMARPEESRAFLDWNRRFDERCRDLNCISADELLGRAPPPAEPIAVDREPGMAAHGPPLAAAPWPDAGAADQHVSRRTAFRLMRRRPRRSLRRSPTGRW